MKHDIVLNDPPVAEREIEALLEATRAAAAPIPLGPALDGLLAAALRLFDAEEGSIQLLEQGLLRIAASRGIPPRARTEVVPLGSSIAGHVAATGRPAVLGSAVEVERFPGYVPKNRRIHAAICVPLRANGETLGTLSINRMRPGRRFGSRDEKLALLFAEHAAHAILARRLLAGAERDGAEAETMRAANADLATTLDVNALADLVLARASTISGSTAGLVCLTDGNQKLTAVRYRGLSRESVRATVATEAFREILASREIVRLRTSSPSSPIRLLQSALGDIEMIALPLASTDGDLGGTLLVTFDEHTPGTERLLRSFSKDAARALANADLHQRVAMKEQELGTIVDSVPMPIVLVDRQGNFRAINPAAAETFRLSPEFETGQSVKGKLEPELEAMLTGPEELAGREVTLAVRGAQHTFRAVVTGVSLRSGSGARVLVLHDMTAEREVEQRKADFLAVLGHELRTPLTSIRGFTSTVLRSGHLLEPAARDEALERVLVQAERLERLIEDLLFVSRVEERRPPLRITQEDVVMMIAETIEEQRRRTPNRVIVLEASVRDVAVSMDRIKVEQVLAHLVDNALKYSAPETSVHVRVGIDGGDVRIAIADAGIGIYSGDLPRLFRPFGQLDPSQTRRYGGTGVGLHVCKTLVEAFGGRIWAQSVIGKGSTFTFTIPTVPPQVSPVVGLDHPAALSEPE